QYCPCDFAEHCPYYRQQMELPKNPDILSGIAVDEAVECYVRLQEQKKELETEIDEIKQIIIKFCQTEGLNRVYGKEHAITCKPVDRIKFDEDEIREILEPLGLWQQVLSFDQSRLKKLITNEAVTEDIRAKLEVLKQVISTSPKLWIKKLSKE
ncbi:MAG: PD-(D/E)XK nuclease family protein, partial [Dehalococcoidales bacterium]|nr:PD-(D/E)XK nuclease family protein [Dehalococcoidales bacterium]